MKIIEAIIGQRMTAASALGLSREDLRGTANLALCEALRTWRPDGGASWETYLYRGVTFAVNRALAVAAGAPVRELQVDLEAPEASPERIAILRRALEVLRARLRPDDWRILSMVAMGWTAAELADYHETTQEVMRARICRARKNAVTILGPAAIS